jgi:transposase-like protein
MFAPIVIIRNDTMPVCPHCHTDWIKRVHRSKLERLLHRDKKKYLCEKCEESFFVQQQRDQDPDSLSTKLSNEAQD